MRVLWSLAFLFPTLLFYAAVILVIKDPDSFIDSKNRIQKESLNRRNNTPVRQKRWYELFDFPTPPMLYSSFKKKTKQEKLAIIERNVNITRDSMNRMRAGGGAKKKVRSAGRITHELHKYYGVEELKRQIEKIKIKKAQDTMSFLRRSAPEDTKGKILNGILAFMIMYTIFIWYGIMV
jgi:hypothetical protein